MLAKIIVFVLAIAAGINAQAESSRPCPNNSVDCMRNYFGTRTSCDLKTFRNVPKEFSIENVRFSADFFNTTHVDQYVNFRNMDRCQIVEFTVNSTNQVTVISLECTNLRVEANRAFYIRNPDRFYVVRIVAEYDSVRLTKVVRGTSPLDYCRGKVYAQTTIPTLFLQGRDRASVEFARTDEPGFFGENLPVWNSIIWHGRAPVLMGYYLRNIICDFQCYKCCGCY